MGTMRSQLVLPTTAQADALLLSAGNCIKYFDCSVAREREEFIFVELNSTFNVITAATCKDKH